MHASPTAIAAVAMRFMRHESWDDALFVHYPVDAAALQRRLPPGLVVDTHDGVAYVGVVLLTESALSHSLRAPRSGSSDGSPCRTTR